jgi:hypothetical protein
MHLVTLAFQQAGEKFSHAAVVAAIQRYRATFVRRVTPEDYERLAQVAHREVPRDSLTARLLYHPAILILACKGFEVANGRRHG